MGGIWLAFITGLTTGGLSCLAVQGGLLASTLAQEVEKEVARKKVVSSLLVFLASKLAAYTLLGLFLGWVGTMLQLTPYMRAALQIAIGTFMVGMALRMLNAHPIFRHFVIEPPKAVTRFVRRYAKKSDVDLISAGFLGALTVLIPCGITQAMMVTALGTGSPLTGAAIMFAFVLGTSPLFFILAYLATRLGEGLHGRFTKVAAVLVLVLGLVSLEGGLNLAGSPVSYAQLKTTLSTPKAPVYSEPGVTSVSDSPEPAMSTPNPAEGNIVNLTADSYVGYLPAVTVAKAGEPIKLVIASKDLYSCASAFVIPKLNVQRSLPANGTTTIDIPAQPKGRLAYSCSMGMYTGSITIQ
jgi:sulfite exporter TauE/SafE